MTSFSKSDGIAASFIWGEKEGSGPIGHLISPVDQTVLQDYFLLTETELDAAICGGPDIVTANAYEIAGFAQRLSMIMKESYGLFLEATQRETGFNGRDSREIVEGAIEYAWRYPCEAANNEAKYQATANYRTGDCRRSIEIHACSWGTVALILPQNAFLLLAVTGMLNALAAGNRVLLRPPLQSARSAFLFSEALKRAGPPQNAVGVVLSKGRDFIAALQGASNPCLIHFMGSSRHASDILADSFQNGKAALVDGEGNGWAWVDKDVDMEAAVDILTTGALRFNGQTCTSINGAIIHPDIYVQLRQGLVERWKALTAGKTLVEEDYTGPLFDVAQAEFCQERLAGSGAYLLCGNRHEANLFYPTLVENPSRGSALVKEGLFGPALWITPGDRDQFVSMWRDNRYPLSATVLSANPDSGWWMRRLSNLARLTINGDPSDEYLFEPWGGYPASGNNRVGSWFEKYQRPVQIDVPETGSLDNVFHFDNAVIGRKDTTIMSELEQNNGVRRKLRSLYARYVDLLYNRNVPAILEMLTPDYILECADGATLDLDATEVLLKEQCAALEPGTTLQIEIEAVVLDGAKAIAAVTEKTIPADIRTSHDSATVQPAERLKEIWVCTEGAWKISRTIVLPVEASRAA